MSRLVLLGVALCAVACAPAAARGPGTPASRSVPAAAADSLAGPWTFRNLGRPRTQRITLTAVLQSRVDTLVREDTLASQTLLEWSQVPQAAPPRIVGMVRDFAVIVGGDSAWRALPDLPMPVSFAAEVGAESAPRFVQPGETSCDARAAAVQALRETWLAPPMRVAPGDRWRDSTDFVLCRDGIPLAVRALRHYAVLGAAVRDGRLVLQVQRVTTTALSGDGLQFGDTVRVRGEGRGEALLEVSLDGAAILHATGSSELRLELQGRRRTQQLVQHGALVIASP